MTICLNVYYLNIYYNLTETAAYKKHRYSQWNKFRLNFLRFYNYKGLKPIGTDCVFLVSVSSYLLYLTYLLAYIDFFSTTSSASQKE